MPALLFSYGTLQQEKTQWSVYRRKLYGYPDTVQGYVLKEQRITDPSFLARGESNIQRTLLFTGKDVDAVTGMVFELSDEELVMTDQYEPPGYTRIQVELVSGRKAWVYGMQAK